MQFRSEFITMLLCSSLRYASEGRTSVEDYESDFYTDDDDKNNHNELNSKAKTSVVSEKECIVEDLEVQSDISDDFWNTVGDEQSLGNISFFERIGEAAVGERKHRAIGQEDQKESESIAEDDYESSTTPAGKQEPTTSNISVNKFLHALSGVATGRGVGETIASQLLPRYYSRFP